MKYILLFIITHHRPSLHENSVVYFHSSIARSNFFFFLLKQIEIVKSKVRTLSERGTTWPIHWKIESSHISPIHIYVYICLILFASSRFHCTINFTLICYFSYLKYTKYIYLSLYISTNVSFKLCFKSKLSVRSVISR